MNRIYYLDRLRTFASFLAVLSHISGGVLNSIEQLKFHDYPMLFIIYCTTRLVVPVFMLLLGVLYLNNHNRSSFNNIFKNTLPKVVVPVISFVP